MMFLKRLLLLVLFFMWVVPPTWATIINVPGDQPTIQAGIDAAVDNDTVLVAPDVYYENIHFREKGIVVASHYILDNNNAYIDSTVINGSNPANPDTASCILIVSDSAYTTEDTLAALIGFTITQGTGTKWQDEHGAGLYREGGGILTQYLSPRIRNNIIINNQATDLQGVTSGGGGGIRIGDGNPSIMNNIIVSNSALYGGGIVLNYTGALIKNNIIAYDSADGAYGGGGGIWAYANASSPKIIENNVIVYNYNSTAYGAGGIRIWSASVTLRNNIIWWNIYNQIYGSPTVTYCDVQGGWAGEGNIDADPLFAAENFYLSDSSPCIDAGDTSSLYNDPEDPYNPGYAEWPSMGVLRNDMGAYGGPDRAILPYVPFAVYEIPNAKVPQQPLLQIHPNPFSKLTTIKFQMQDVRSKKQDISLKIYDVAGKLVKAFLLPTTYCLVPTSIGWDGTDTHSQPVSSGIYFCRVQVGDDVATKKMTLIR